MNDEDRHTPVRVYTAQQDEPEDCFAKGGLVHAASKVKKAGRMGDGMVVHINKREFEELRSKWGDPTINPETGMPEFFLGSLGKILKKIAGPAVGGIAGAFLPGIGDALGTVMPSLQTVLGSTGLQALAAAGLGAGAGYITDGGTGALLGGLAGVGGAYGADWLDGGLGDAAATAGVDTAASELPGVAKELAFNPNAGGSLLERGLSKIPPATLLGVLSMAGNALGGDPAAKAAEKQAKKDQARFNQPLVPWTNPRKRNEQAGMRDYTQAGETNYFSDNALGSFDPVKKADGGFIERQASGLSSLEDSGRSDTIDAKLSEGEYVIDAETVALIGDGSNQAGADRLDQLRANIRQHKGAALAQGENSPNAAPLEQYLGSA